MECVDTTKFVIIEENEKNELVNKFLKDLVGQ